MQILLLMVLMLVSNGNAALGQQASASPGKPETALTPIRLAKVPLAAQSALASLKEIEANVSADESGAEGINRAISAVTNEIDSRIADDTRLLTASPSLDMLYRLKLTWQSFGLRLSVADDELTRSATRLEEQFGRLDQLNKTWLATLQAAKQPETPSPVLQRVQGVVDAVQQTRETTESSRENVWSLQSSLSGEEARVGTVLSLIERAENQALQNIFVRDSSPILSLKTGLGSEWRAMSGQSFFSQVKASVTFAKRLPFIFLFHALLIGLTAGGLHWMRRRIRKSTKENPDLQRVLPILDLPVSTALALSMLLVPSIYAQAPRLVDAMMGAVTLIPTTLILRRLLVRNSYPILNAIVILYFVGQLRILGASLPVLARFLFLGQVLGASIFLVWIVRRWHLSPEDAQTHGRFWRIIRAIAKIGLVLLPVSFLANIFGYVNFGNLLGIVFFRSVYIAAVLYTAIRIIEGLVTVALQVRPLGSLRVIILHRPMLQQRTCRLLEFLAFLFWLNVLLNFLGLRTPFVAATATVLNTTLAAGSFNITLGRILAFLITVWASFLVSKFLRFLLEEDVYHHLHLARGISYAISTMLHYLILLLGLFVALGVLGIDLAKVTILAGAFTVGIGFGLQNVINNFVSGVILLFERPIKVGDVIEVGGNVGEVSRIGIRASVIRTADGSEVIVPNGSLISSQVTNWTFSDSRRAVEVSINVVAGVDHQRVVDLLKMTAAKQPGVAKEPLPQVYVVSFSSGAVTFQLRAWTDRNEEWAQLRSDLSVAVNDALAREQISIA